MNVIWDYLPVLLPFIAVGFAAQLIDGALGMAYGVISSTLLLAIGLPPKAASAGTHAAETFTTAISGLSHIYHRNVDWGLFIRLAIPGIIGGVTGAYLLSNVDSSAIKPYVQSYLTTIGLWLIWRSTHVIHPTGNPRVVTPLGLFGGFLDATGGGGWGPVVTSNLLLQGANPRMTIGTVNTAEFLLTLSISLTFLIHLGWETFTMATLGLLIGGVLAAPLGALLAKHIPANRLLLLVGVVLTLTSLYGIAKSLGLAG
ncbi:MAG: sulfite exporter TauE/SafE family protein [Sphingobium sp.]|nr:sulfite exporter TauE/SafE family protein [Sphingobium sp.]MBP6112466.1 sulfite exporter TauE/SafE family protein [Sphingobium sp.]MBP8671006.1 sulfite exporter TauE/SafE family protein [Sphingobium sp.]MBP9158156.1 sulfite exporter TauE/SafE family protein [Sphingobium sp.]MCC6482678.1 sulfite exporter TauE/SafE family protein [Sphingomonadaceae bacterium]